MKISPENWHNVEIKTMSLSTVTFFIANNYNANNILIFNNISMELYIFTIGLISRILFDGAMFYLDIYCYRVTKPDDVDRAYDELTYLRTYLIMFRRILIIILKKINVDFNIDTTDNIYSDRMMYNLSEMIRLTTISNYGGKNKHDRFMNMKRMVQAEYGTLVSKREDISVAKIKLYILKPILRIRQFLDFL